MALCVALDINGFLIEAVGQTESTCTAYLLQTAAEYQHLNSLDSLFSLYLGFDLEMAEFIMVSMLVAFISGHTLGRVISGLRKAG